MPAETPAEHTNGLSDFDENSGDEEPNEGDGNKDDQTATDRRRRSESEGFNFDYTKTQEYRDLLTEFNQNLLCAIKVQLKNASALVRRATILLLEFAATTNLDINELLLSYVSSQRKLFITSRRYYYFNNFHRTSVSCISINRHWCVVNWSCHWTKY